MFFRHHQLPPSSWPERALARAELFLDQVWIPRGQSRIADQGFVVVKCSAMMMAFIDF